MMKHFLILLLGFQNLHAAGLREILLELESSAQSLQKKTSITLTSEEMTVAKSQSEAAIAKLVSLRSTLSKDWDSFLVKLQTVDSERRSLIEHLDHSNNPAPDTLPGNFETFPATKTLLRAHVLGGNTGPMMMALELVVAHLRVGFYRLHLTHALAQASGFSALPLAEFESIRFEMHHVLGVLMTLFLDFPEVRFGSLRKPDGTVNVEKLTAFFQQFSTPAKNSSAKQLHLPKDLLKGISNAVFMAESTEQNLENYHLLYYPQSYRTEALGHLAENITLVPGLRECINLTRGLSELSTEPITLSDFEGPTCDFPAFKNALQRYIGFYRKQVGWTLVPSLVDFFTTARDIPGLDISAELKSIVHEYPTDSPIHEKWNAMEQSLSESKNVSQWLKADPLSLTRDFKTLLKNNDIPVQDGFDVSYSENMSQAQSLLKHSVKFDHSSPLVSVDSQMSCEPFISNTLTKQRTVQVIRQADAIPMSESSATQYSRQVPLYEVRVSNLTSIQNPEKDHITLAGLIQYTVAKHLSINYVQTQKNLGRTPRALDGVGFSETPFTKLVISKYRLSDFRTILEDQESKEFDQNKYRAKVFQAARQLRQLDSLITQLQTRGGSTIGAPPGLAKILNIPPKFTQETNSNVASQMNQTLIDLVSYVRWDFLKRHNPGKSNREIQRLTSSTKLTIDQFNEQLSWYRGIERGHQVRPPRSTDFIGHDELEFLQKHPVIQALTLNHVSEILDGPLEYAQWSRDWLMAKWPVLTYVNPSTGAKTKVWRTYEDVDFEKTLERHLSMIRETASIVLKEDNLETLLEMTLVNHSLIDFILRRFPDQKLAVCQEQSRIRNNKARTTAVVGGLSALALGLSLIPEVGPAAAFIPGVIAIGVTSLESRRDRIHAASTEAYQIASLAQRSDFERAHDPDYLRFVEDTYFETQINQVLSLAALAAGGSIRFAKFGKSLSSFREAFKMGQSMPGNFLKSWGQSIRAQALSPIKSSSITSPALRFGVQLSRSFYKGSKTVGEFVLFPLHRLGLTAHLSSDWRLFSKLSPNLARWQRFAIRSAHTVEDGAHLIINLPLIPLGAQIGSGTAAQYFMGFGAYELAHWGVHAWNSYKGAARQVAIARIGQNMNDDPSYASLIDSVYQGDITMNEAAKIIELDSKYGFQESLNDVLAQIEPNNQRDHLIKLRQAMLSIQSEDKLFELAQKRAVIEIDKSLDRL